MAQTGHNSKAPNSIPPPQLPGQHPVVAGNVLTADMARGLRPLWNNRFPACALDEWTKLVEAACHLFHLKRSQLPITLGRSAIRAGRARRALVQALFFLWGSETTTRTWAALTLNIQGRMVTDMLRVAEDASLGLEHETQSLLWLYAAETLTE